MDIGMEAGIFLGYAAGLFIVYFFGRMMLVPLKKILKFMAGSVIGGLCLIILNLMGGVLGISVPINIITAVVVGILGIPGLAVLVIYFNVLL